MYTVSTGSWLTISPWGRLMPEARIFCDDSLSRTHSDRKRATPSQRDVASVT